MPCHSTAWRCSKKQPRLTMWLSNNVALPTIVMDQLNAMETAAVAAVVAVATNSQHIHSQEQRDKQMDNTPMPYKHFENWNYCHTHGGNINNGHTSRTCTKPGPTHNPHATRTTMMNRLPPGLHKMILPLASGRAPHVPRQQCPPTPATWQQPPPPIILTTHMLQMMPPAPYRQMHYIGQQFRPLPSQLTQPAPPAPAPPAGTMMMPYYAPYPQPCPF
jgi:hypothetical protein